MDEEDLKLDKHGNPFYKPSYMKVKIPLDYNSSRPYIKITENKEGNRTLMKSNTFQDVADALKYLSKVRFILNFNKLYVMKNSNGGTKKMYGISILATHAEVIPRNKPNGMYEIQFIDSSEEETTEKPFNIKRA